MLKNRLITPEGTKDVLFEECAARRLVEEKIKTVFEARGYSEVITPALEFYDVFHSGTHGISEEGMYKLIDLKGRILAVKPDLTMPIARLAATRLKGHTLPLRFYYNQNVYRLSPALSGRSDEIPQIGIELIGSATKRTDLEVLVTALDALESCEIDSFRLEIGHIGFFNLLMEELEVKAEVKEEIRLLIESKNYPALNDRLDRLRNPEVAEALKKLPALFGGEEVLEQAANLYDSDRWQEIVTTLRLIYADLSKLGLHKRITLDLGIVNRNDYYTGVVFNGYLEGIGAAVLTGGRYDTLLSDYGVDLPAVGFAIHVDAVARSLNPNLYAKRLPDVLVFAVDGYEVKALNEISKLARMGFLAEFSVYESFDESRNYAIKRGIPNIYMVNEDIVEVRV